MSNDMTLKRVCFIYVSYVYVWTTKGFDRRVLKNVISRLVGHRRWPRVTAYPTRVLPLFAMLSCSRDVVAIRPGADTNCYIGPDAWPSFTNALDLHTYVRTYSVHSVRREEWYLLESVINCTNLPVTGTCCGLATDILSNLWWFFAICLCAIARYRRLLLNWRMQHFFK